MDAIMRPIEVTNWANFVAEKNKLCYFISG